MTAPPLQDITQCSWRNDLMSDTESHNRSWNNDNINGCFGMTSVNDLSLTSNRNYQSKMSYKNI